jgi:hypothetical protein
MPERREGTQTDRTESRTGGSAATRRLGELRRAQPADATLKNLLGLLTMKLELCAQLPVFEWEARNDGHEACARKFSALAQDERNSFAEVLECLRAHLEQTASRMPV